MGDLIMWNKYTDNRSNPWNPYLYSFFHAVQITYFQILPLKNNTLKKISTLLLKDANHDAVFLGGS